MAHLIGKCRREVILECFGEETSQIDISEVCCDVCRHKSSTSLTESTKEIQVVIKATLVLAESGE